MTETRRDRHRLATAAQIKTVARGQMAEQGAAALSLRAIAREMGITAPAIYRYYPSRDDLVTALIADAYDHLTAEIRTAAEARPADDLFGRFMDVGLAYRSWALAHPADYALILGTPIPGYHAPSEITRPDARGGMAVLVDLLLAANAASGGVEPPAASEPAPPEPAAWPGSHEPPPQVRHLALATWAQMHGLVSLELFGHVAALTADPAALYCREMVALAARAGIHPQPNPPSTADRGP